MTKTRGWLWYLWPETMQTNCPPRICPLTYVQWGLHSHECACTKTYSGSTRAHWIRRLCSLSHFKTPLEWVFRGSYRRRQEMQDKEDGIFPELNCLSLTSEYLRILVSWQACLARCSWQARPYRCALGFRPRSGHLLLPETTPESGLAAAWCTGSKKRQNPFPCMHPALCQYMFYRD